MPTGVYLHARKAYPPEFVQRVSDLYSSGLAQHEVARKLQTTQKVIWTVMRNHGIARRPAIKRDQARERNSSWKPEASDYATLHYRVAAARGRPKRCEQCGTTDAAKHYDWANLTGNYADVNDYRRMCRSCHHRFDGRAKNLGRYAIAKRKEDARESHI